MPALNHPDYQNELKRLNLTIEYVKKYKEIMKKQKINIDKAVDYGKSHYNSDNVEQFNELVINEVRQNNLNNKLKNITISLGKPYFARVDFKENTSSKIDNLYIGKMSLLNEESGEFLIIDWRSPVANLYYEGRLGSASYKCPEGSIKGDISLKRQYTIENSNLKEIFDIDITTNDNFLQAALGSNKDNRLKDIVSTIQAEQNRVIRANMWNPLIVQGAAGGGKTTIALHRIAYLMYNHEKTIKPENFMIMAPNRFFLSYISEVLPELGVENVTQTTFEDFAFKIIKKNLDENLKLISPHTKLSQLIENSSNNLYIENELITKSSSFKSSLEFKNLLLKYLNYIEYTYIPKEDFKINNFILLTYKEIQKQFIKDYSHLPFIKRLEEIKKSIINKINRQKDKIIDNIYIEYDYKVNEIKNSMNDCKERRNEIIKVLDERDELLLKIKKELKNTVKEYICKIPKRSINSYYKNFLKNLTKLKNPKHSIEILNYIEKYSLDNLNKKQIEFEDLAPLIYINILIYGLDEYTHLKHIVIDEAQDFSLFQFYILKNITKNKSFTILGDLCQGIYSFRGIENWNLVKNLIFSEDSPNYLCLEQSYRTTIEIMNFANKIIKNLQDTSLPKAKPVIRHGKYVETFKMNSIKEIANDISIKIETLHNKNYKSIAIICKTLDECKKLKSSLKTKENISIITEKEIDYSGGIVIIPCHLAKGLEFDVVIIANASKEVYKKNNLDIKLLYVGMTRPLHEMYIYFIGEKSELLNL